MMDSKQHSGIRRVIGLLLVTITRPYRERNENKVPHRMDRGMATLIGLICGAATAFRRRFAGKKF